MDMLLGLFVYHQWQRHFGMLVLWWPQTQSVKSNHYIIIQWLKQAWNLAIYW